MVASLADKEGGGEGLITSTVLYVDENSVNRKLAEVLLVDIGANYVSAPNLVSAIDICGKQTIDVVILDVETAQTDKDGIVLAGLDPRFRELPKIAVGQEDTDISEIGASVLVPAPLDALRLSAALAKARPNRTEATTLRTLLRSSILSRVGGNPLLAAEILQSFINDYSEAANQLRDTTDAEDVVSIATILRGLRAAASTLGAETLYEATVAGSEERLPTEQEIEAVRVELRKTIYAAAQLIQEFFGGTSRTGAKLFQDFKHIAKNLSPEQGHTPRKDTPASPLLRQLSLDEPPFLSWRQEKKMEPHTDEGTKKALILIVDDSSTNRLFLREQLADEYHLLLAPSGEEALALARGEEPPTLILLDVTMPGMDGYEVCRRLKEDPRTRPIPIIFLTSMSKVKDEESGLALGAVDYIRKPFSTPILKARVRTHIELARHQRFLETLVDERSRELRETQREVIYRLAMAAEYRDNDTGSHIKRLGYYASTLAESLGIPRSESDIMYFASWMHDVGKLGIPDHILLKPGKLAPHEWKIMQTHTTIGAAILGGHPSELLRSATRIALTHHEKWDGSGYPTGIAGEDIPLEGRIVAICDVFDALLSERPYKAAWTFEATLDEINRLSGKSFDPSIVKVFNDHFDELLNIKSSFPD